MKTDIKALRKRIAQLYPKRDRGDLTEKDFQREVTEQTVELYRAVITDKLAESEIIECEHHTIWTHFRLMQSILREPAQQAISLFLTNRKLYTDCNRPLCPTSRLRLTVGTTHQWILSRLTVFIL